MRIAVSALGCKTNQYEMDALAESFRRRGFLLVHAREKAEVYVLNTCTVTAEAERKSRQLLRRYRRRNPEALIVACGCYSQRDDLSGLADLLIGTRERDRLPDLISQALEEGPGLQPARLDSGRWVYEELGAPALPEETRAYLKIQDGCDNRCAYCAICLARGPARSRRLDGLLEEARVFVSQGFKEIVLTGTNLNCYGRDFKEPGSPDLASVLEALDPIPGLRRIRLSSLEAGTITPDFVSRLAQLNHFCPSFHLSLQSGSDRILRLMRRRDTRASFREAVGRIREVLPQAGITTDLIVGFPGETDEDFEETLAFCEAIGFLRIHVFRFSPRPGTAAATLPDRVPGPVAAERSRILRDRAAELTHKAIENRLGLTREVLVEQVDGSGRAEGYTPEYILVRGGPSGTGLLPPVPGEIQAMRITGFEDGLALASLL